MRHALPADTCNHPANSSTVTMSKNLKLSFSPSMPRHCNFAFDITGFNDVMRAKSRPAQFQHEKIIVDLAHLPTGW